MAQSYGNLSTSPILAATDEIMGTSSLTQKIGTAMSADDPADTLGAGLTLGINIDADGIQFITLAAHTDLLDTAAEIQSKVRLLTPIGFGTLPAFQNFTARWDAALKRLVLTSGTADVPLATPSVVVTGGTAAPDLKLGAAQGGTESRTGAEVVDYTIKYRFALNAGKNFGTAELHIPSSIMVVPTSLAEAVTIANARATQLKAELILNEYAYSNSTTYNGPVVL